LDENITKTKGQYQQAGLHESVLQSYGRKYHRRDRLCRKLGYSINNAGELDYSSLVQKDMKGPYIVKDTAWLSSLPFAAEWQPFNRNGAVSSPPRYAV
jgi:hypothetical protein